MENDLQRFVIAQSRDYTRALAEIRAGKKQSHWIWYIFPQLTGLGSSHNATYYGLANLDEAMAYLKHPALGPRLIELSKALLQNPGNNATAIMGSPDDLKLRSCMTLFAEIPDAEPVFGQVLDKLFKGQKDEKTLALLTGK